MSSFSEQTVKSSDGFFFLFKKYILPPHNRLIQRLRGKIESMHILEVEWVALSMVFGTR